MKSKRVHAGYTRQEWREMRGYGPGFMPKLHGSIPTPRDRSDIELDLCHQLERLWSRLPKEFRQ